MIAPQSHAPPSAPPAAEADFDYVVLLAKLGSAVAHALEDGAVCRPYPVSA